MAVCALGANATPHGLMSAALQPRTDVGLTWLVTIRWASIGAQVAAIAVGHFVLQLPTSLGLLALLIGIAVASNAILTVQMRRHILPTRALAGIVICGDTIILAWILACTGGPLNPLSIFFLVHIVMAALVLGRVWTWGVTALCACAYAALFLATSPALAVAQHMHPEVAEHFRGMWWAFAGTALLIALFVTRLSKAIADRDDALAVLRDAAARSERLSSLATLAAGAAHELSTPLGTIVVAAHEAERTLAQLPTPRPDVLDDITLIGAEAHRCRSILDAMAVDTGQPSGEMPQTVSSQTMLERVLAQIAVADRGRVHVTAATAELRWPVRTMARAVGNVVQNGLDASPADTPVNVTLSLPGVDRVCILVTDGGVGIDGARLARIGEPFYTTKTAGHGLGLGVFVARTTTERVRGVFELRSTPGRGTSVTMTVPRLIGEFEDQR